ncbi:creatininase family protein [Clostridium sp. AF18-27]|uniref:3-dehydro-scyllo-inosose hydrolase n=1 Tax=Enterocloster TaxID=2719313 RepID=UPI000E486DAD|nr:MULTISPECIES: 3-dehydro-scyllo-inosose hydrolase [Enterocloster]MCB6346865.1 creatininase family protein [Enterocloster lavalensis]MDR3756150.1 3-dehydro-scyllo-inosose hydrolase [Enterocloster sp.]RHR47361.1 creatininase family protein [Clostridium sp. AF18-27]
MSKWQIPYPQEVKVAGYMDSDEPIYFQNMTMKQSEERLKENDILILPIGSTECHGAHACYGEDTFLVTRMAEQVAKKTGCTVSQPIWFGSHPYHHMGMPGTIPINENTFCDYIAQVLAGFWNAGYRKIILLNGHGQEYVIPTAIHQFARKYQVPAVMMNVNWYYAIPEYLKVGDPKCRFETPFNHADEQETSFSLALFPEMIHMEDAPDTDLHTFLPPGHIDNAGNIYGRAVKWYCHAGAGTIEVVGNPEGVVGKAKLATAEKAIPATEALLDYLEKLVNDIHEKWPAGVLPECDKVTQRFTEETLEDLKKGPLNGGKHIYTIAAY